MSDGPLTVSASEFKAKCLGIFDALVRGKLDRVIVTRRGKPVAEIVPPSGERLSIWGAHPGSARVAPGVDLTEPVLEEPLDAAEGVLLGTHGRAAPS